MKTIPILLAATVAVLATGAAAQPSPAACPVIELHGPDQANDRRTLRFVVEVRADGSVDPTYNWTVSTGMIRSGQGTKSITVNAEGETSVTATVEVGGFDPACKLTVSKDVDLVD